MTGQGHDPLDDFKRQAAIAAVDAVESGMVVGLGHGSTAIHAVRELAARLADGRVLDVRGAPCSREVAAKARSLGIPLVTLEDVDAVDLTIDGADALTSDCDAIKGGGGALLSEKIVHQNSRRVILVADHTKLSGALGSNHALPVEIAPFGWGAQHRFISELGADATLRRAAAADGEIEPFVTDHGHYILDCRFGPIDDPDRLAYVLSSRAGVMEHGLFINLAQEAVVAGPDGVVRLNRGAALL